ncbi:MAG TPA: 4-(cytidine 5'-diphospho)-2-C-methyl-D-erythritol kinase, partial [Thermoanaerobaculia bacterium]|nr:4-(cytidine 5'-diphospho)-2-C-methyl-D-erythritol kinase [Thermoanaerobaculia bacterium]
MAGRRACGGAFLKLSLATFAKVNRSLVVVGKRPDGYHELDTVFQTIDLTDELSFEDADRLTLRVDDPAIPANEENLVLKAATALAGRYGVTRGASIVLSKRIPAGAGLGGGSGNAAGALRGLAALWSLEPTEGELHDLAEGLGSDVPFFLVGGRARGRGRGEVLEALSDGAEEALVVLVPPFPLATPDVYRRVEAVSLTGSGTKTSLPGSGGADEPDRNDLEP